MKYLEGQIRIPSGCAISALISREALCVNCGRCVAFCPTYALKILKSPPFFRENENWSSGTIQEIYRQAKTGGVLLSSMGNPNPLPVYWDRILLNASQVTTPSVDPLREPMETRVFLGKKPEKIQRGGGRQVPMESAAPAGTGDSRAVFRHELRLHQLQRPCQPG